MIFYIDEYEKENLDKSRRKFDVIWGVVSVTLIAFILSIGKSVWDSYGFKGDEALIKGMALFIIAVMLGITLIFVMASFYDIFIIRPSEERLISLALQEILLKKQGCEMAVTKEKVTRENVLIEEYD